MVSVSNTKKLSYCRTNVAEWVSMVSFVLSCILQIHEKEEEMNEKNDNANCLSEEPLLTADQVTTDTCTSYKKNI